MDAEPTHAADAAGGPGEDEVTAAGRDGRHRADAGRPAHARCVRAYVSRAGADRPRPRRRPARGLRRSAALARARGRRAAGRSCPSRLLLRRGRGRRARRGGAPDAAGAPSRRGELPAVEAALARYRPIERRRAAGDARRRRRAACGPHASTSGRSARTNEAGIARLAAVAEPLGYRVVPACP